MAFSEKASSPTVPTNRDPNRLNRQVASVPQTVRRHRRKGNRISDGSHVVVEAHGNGNVAEGEGFEPPKACTLVVFKTTAIDHSAIPPATINNTAALTPLGDAWGQRSTKAAEARRCRSSR